MQVRWRQLALPGSSWMQNSAPTQQRLLALKQEQEKLESERVALEELRRRRREYVRGRDEMIGHLTRGISLLEEAQEDARRNGIAMGESIEDFRNHLDKVSALSESEWEEAHLQRELTRSLTTMKMPERNGSLPSPDFPFFQPSRGGPEGASGHDPEGCRRIDPSVDQSFRPADDPYGARTDLAFGSDPPF